MPYTTKHPLYTVWHSMIERCRNPNFKQWHRYGGRGIYVCERWSRKKGEGFWAFVEDMGPRPEGYVMDRINNEEGYSPDNCRWITRKESQRNQSRTIMVTIEGKQYKAIELAEKTGLKCDTIVSRSKRGLTMKQMLNTKRRVFYDGLKIGWKYGRGAGNR